ncbi:MAG: 3-dehydroquinate synthase [Firmicutes bacterium]|nr:3-dehydroquinate synthase [Bacillota bacterium]
MTRERVSGSNIILAGFMGAGKSSVGRCLAALLEMAHLDTDALVEAEAGATISEIFRTRGEAWFRRLEARAVRQASQLNNTVISVGGGALMDQRNVALLKRAGLLVWLRTSPESVVARLRAEGTSSINARPVLAGKADLEQVRSLMSARESGYRQAHIAVDTDGKRPDEIACQIAREIAWETDSGAHAPCKLSESAEMPPAFGRDRRCCARERRPNRCAFTKSVQPDRTNPCTLEILAGASAYPYLLGYDLLARPDTYRAALAAPTAPGGPGSGDMRLPGRIIVVTTPLLRLLFGGQLEEGLRGWLGHDPSIVWAMVPDGERAKSLATLAKLYDLAAASGAGRDSLAIALGGGTVGDVAGFFAATYMRGIRLVQVPTTLLAMVDSAIGGKTAINLRAAKNLAGTFWQPAAVIADIATLGTLPLRDLTSGLAEVVKAAVIGDPGLFETLEHVARVVGGAETCSTDGCRTPGLRRPRAARFAAARTLQQEPALWQDIVRGAVMVKAKIVATDERDAGDRLLLNLGHTLGHAIERAGGFRRWTHGEAVAIGLAAACRASARLGYLQEDASARVIRLLTGLGLPTSVPLADGGALRKSILTAMALDKKARGGKLRVVLPLSIGRCSICEDPAAEALAEEIAMPTGLDRETIPSSGGEKHGGRYYHGNSWPEPGPVRRARARYLRVSNP